MKNLSLEPSIDVIKPDPTDDLVRLGTSADGGYVIPSCVVHEIDMIVSLGIEDEWSFEDAFLNVNPSVRLVGVDGTTGYAILAYRTLRSAVRLAVSVVTLNRSMIAESRLALRLRAQRLARFVAFWFRPRQRFLAKMVRRTISTRSETNWGSLRRHWAPSTKLLIKVDIEGSEYEVLQQIIDSPDLTVCLIVEFHDLDQNWGAFSELVSRLRDRFRLVHAHGNNWGGTFGVHQIPKVVELTFVAPNLATGISETRVPLRPYPVHGLDFPNNPRVPDIPLPFGD